MPHNAPAQINRTRLFRGKGAFPAPVELIWFAERNGRCHACGAVFLYQVIDGVVGDRI
jgi:hypothetical protein